MPDATERTPLVGTTHVDDTPLEIRAEELLRAGAGGIAVPLTPDMDLTHELASALYALHVVERHDRARGSARAAAYRASETLRTRVALRQRAILTLDDALSYCATEEHSTRDEDDDDVLVLSRALPVRDRYTTRELVCQRTLRSEHVKPPDTCCASNRR